MKYIVNVLVGLAILLPTQPTHTLSYRTWGLIGTGGLTAILTPYIIEKISQHLERKEAENNYYIAHQLNKDLSATINTIPETYKPFFDGSYTKQTPTIPEEYEEWLAYVLIYVAPVSIGVKTLNDKINGIQCDIDTARTQINKLTYYATEYRIDNPQAYTDLAKQLETRIVEMQPVLERLQQAYTYMSNHYNRFLAYDVLHYTEALAHTYKDTYTVVETHKNDEATCCDRIDKVIVSEYVDAKWPRVSAVNDITAYIKILTEIYTNFISEQKAKENDAPLFDEELTETVRIIIQQLKAVRFYLTNTQTYQDELDKKRYIEYQREEAEKQRQLERQRIKVEEDRARAEKERAEAERNRERAEHNKAIAEHRKASAEHRRVDIERHRRAA